MFDEQEMIDTYSSITHYDQAHSRKESKQHRKDSGEYSQKTFSPEMEIHTPLPSLHQEAKLYSSASRESSLNNRSDIQRRLEYLEN